MVHGSFRYGDACRTEWIGYSADWTEVDWAVTSKIDYSTLKTAQCPRFFYFSVAVIRSCQPASQAFQRIFSREMLL